MNENAGESEIENKVSVEQNIISTDSERSDKNSQNLEISTENLTTIPTPILTTESSSPLPITTTTALNEKTNSCILSTPHAAHTIQFTSQNGDDTVNKHENNIDECVEENASLEERTSSDFQQPIESDAMKNIENSIENTNEIQGNLKIDEKNTTSDNSETNLAIDSDEISNDFNIKILQECIKQEPEKNEVPNDIQNGNSTPDQLAEAEKRKETNEIQCEDTSSSDKPTDDSFVRKCTPPPFMTQFSNPSTLNVIREENSDASDVEQKTEMECWQSADRAKAKKADAVFPKSNFDFTSHGRHSNLVTPKTTAIREEPQLFLVDTKIIDNDTIEESSKKWITTSTDQLRQAELVFLDSTSESSHTSLSDIEQNNNNNSNAGNDSTKDEDSEVRIETPTIGSSLCSAFKPVIIQKSESPPPDKDLSGLRRFLNLPKVEVSSTTIIPCQPPAPPVRCVVPATKPLDKLGELFRSIEATKSLGVETTFKPINENSESLSIQLRNIIASPVSTVYDSDNESVLSHSVYSFTDNHIPITHTHTLNKSYETMQSIPRPDFRIGAPCSNNIFGSLPAITNISKHILSDVHHRQDSSSSYCSSAHSQCTVLCLANRSSLDGLDLLHYFEPNECFSGSSSIQTLNGNLSFKTLRQLCIERLTTLPYGLSILEELANVAESFSHLTDKHNTPRSKKTSREEKMPYPRPDLPRIEDLELNVYPQSPQPLPPPRQKRTVVKFVPNLESRSPVPPPVPERPWLGVPTQEDPRVLVCFSPAQRELLYGNDEHKRNGNGNVADQLLDMHNKFIDRRGYHEYTDDEVKAINFRKSSTGSIAEYEVPVNEKDNKDSRLLALIRDINQLSNTNTRSDISSAASAKSTSSMTNASTTNESYERNRSSASDQSQSDRSSDKMSRLSISSPQSGSDSFNSKRYSSLYDELSRLHTIAEEPQARKRYSTIETATEESQKHIENGKTVYEFNESSAQKSNDRKNSDSSLLNSKLKPSNDVKSEYRCFAESKNSNTNDSVDNRNENDQNNKTDAANEKKRFFKEFDYIPKFFTDMFGRVNKSSSTSIENSDKPTTSEMSESSHKEHKIVIEKTGESSTNLLKAPASTPIPVNKGPNQYLSTQSLYEPYDRNRITPDRCSSSLSTHREGLRRSRSPNVQIRAPRINDSPKPMAKSVPKIDDAERIYATSHSRNFENRQSMIDQTPITRHVSQDWKRMSMSKVEHEKILQNLLDKEKNLGQEFDKLERDRLRLLIELEEMRVNQSFEEFVKQHKSRNGSEQNVSSLSEQELFRKRMQDEWLNKVAEREERRMQKIIKVTNASEVTESSKSLTNRGLGDEFMDRVRERRDKLQMPADSDWESGAESQPIKRENPSPKIDPNVKVIEGEQEADLKNLPEHLKEFAAFVAKKQQEEAKRSTTKATVTEKSSDNHKEIIHKIVLEGNENDSSDGESRI